MIQLGQKVSDVITKFVGLATGRCEYISGCNQVLVAPEVKADGAYVESHWFDEDRLQVVDATAMRFPITAAGPDKPAPRR